jgi:hypothetical protein
MSIDLMSAVWKRGPADTTMRFVLLALADHANDQGYCWPGYDGLAAKCAISRRTAVRAIKQLEVDGWLTLEHRAANGKTMSNGYHLSLAKLGVTPSHPTSRRGDTVTPVGVTQDHPRGDRVSPIGVTECHPNLHLEPSINHQGEPSAAEAERPRAVKRRAAAAAHPRLKAIGLGTNAKTLALLELPHFDDDYAAAMVAWAQRAGKETGLAIKKIEDGDPVPGSRPVDLTRQIPADLADIIQR